MESMGLLEPPTDLVDLVGILLHFVVLLHLLLTRIGMRCLELLEVQGVQPRFITVMKSLG
jgi:hypothetical protein